MLRFTPEVVGHDMELCVGTQECPAVEIEATLGPAVAFAGGNLFRQIHALEAGKPARRRNRGLAIRRVPRHEATVLGTRIAQAPGELARVDIGDRHHATRAQPRRKIHLAAPVAGCDRRFAHDQASSEHPFGLVVECGAAGIADVRIGQRHQLARVGRIREDFLIAGHGGVEHHFAGG
jgi:hypothetical protein